MAADYTLALVFWRTSEDDTTDLVLVEGRPDAYDGVGSPTSYAFDPEIVVHSADLDVTPILMSATWSDGGDLVIGFGYTELDWLPDDRWASRTRNLCAVRPHGDTFTVTQVDVDTIIGRDPSVSLLGHGEALRIFFAYETRDGVALRVSEDAGATFSDPIDTGDREAHTPTVFARDEDGATRVDLLYLTSAPNGTELHLARWDDWGAGAPEVRRLTKASISDSVSVPPTEPVPGGGPGAHVPDGGLRITEVAWLGYDAVIQDGEIVVVYDEVTYDAFTVFRGAPRIERERTGGAEGATPDADFDPAEPPPLAPGMTEELPDPDPAHMHQLRLLRLR
jgi:hypothetical protein